MGGRRSRSEAVDAIEGAEAAEDVGDADENGLNGVHFFEGGAPFDIYVTCEGGHFEICDKEL